MNHFCVSWKGKNSSDDQEEVRALSLCKLGLTEDGCGTYDVGSGTGSIAGWSAQNAVRDSRAKPLNKKSHSTATLCGQKTGKISSGNVIPVDGKAPDNIGNPRTF